jgi:hypothetical protein
MIAHRGFWRENLDVDYTLQSIPFEEQVQFVTLSEPLQTALHNNIWIYYDLPLPYYNGYSCLDDIHGVRFCFGTIAKVIKLTDKNVTIEFKIIKTQTVGELASRQESSPFLKEWEDFFIGFANNHATGSEFSVQKFENYYYVSCGSQGDVGMNCIVSEVSGVYYAFMVNQWSFHEDFIFGGKFKTSKMFADLIVEYSEIAHRIYLDGKIFLKLRDSSFYDTTTPHHWCVAKLKELKTLSNKSELLIVGLGNHTFVIKNQTEFLEWIDTEFKGGFIDYI